MDIKNFMPVRLICGKGVVKDYNFSALGNRCLIMTGKTSAVKSGVLNELYETLDKQNIEYFLFDCVEPNPHVVTCHEAGMMAYEFKADFIIGAGGGSAMDAAKAAAAFAMNETLLPEEIYTAKITRALPFVLIGTTAGTGSEVTAVSVLTYDLDEKPYKKSYKGPLAFAHTALCDPYYTMSLNWDVTSSTALDVISHSIESFFSVKGDVLSQTHALKAVELGWGAIIKAHWSYVVEKKDIAYEQRRDLMTAALLAGLAINVTGTCFPHALGYALTSRKEVPHGRACAHFLPEFIKLMSEADNEKGEMLLTATKEESIDVFISGIESLAGERPVLTMNECYDFAEIAKNAPALNNSIRTIDENEAFRIYKKLFVK